MSRDIEHKKKMTRFKKAQKILDTPDDKLAHLLEQSDFKADPHLLQDYVDYLNSLDESSDPDHMKYLDSYRFRAELDEKKVDDVVEYLSYGEANFKEYKSASLKFEDQLNAIALTGEFRESHNRYFVIEGFVALVRNKFSPPAWMLEALAQGFSKHMSDPDPSKLASQLGLQGKASGKSNPYDEYRRFIERREIVVEMLILTKEFGISQINAAKAVKIKRSLKVSTKTLCNDFRKYEKDRLNAIPNVDYSLDQLHRQKFVERFPPAARRLLKK